MGVSHSVVVGITLVLCLIFNFEIVQGRTWVVGDKGGWDLNPDIQKWPNGKKFKVGDVLVFNYPKWSAYPVIATDVNGYQSCMKGENAKEYRSGHDHITLVKGDNYFISGSPDYCTYGMRIAVNAS